MEFEVEVMVGGAGGRVWFLVSEISVCVSAGMGGEKRGEKGEGRRENC